jgi:adenosylcobyric acid synthase
MSPLPEEETTSAVAGGTENTCNVTVTPNKDAWGQNDRRHHLPSLAVLGTGSDVGKSVIAAGLCRLLANNHLRVAPFKAQNMSNNSHPALISKDNSDDEGSNSTNKGNGNVKTISNGAWGEIGVAQAVQAEACRLVPRVEMNPLLLKSGGRRESTGEYLCSVVVLGKHLCTEDYGALGNRTDELRNLILDAHDRLGTQTDAQCIVLEGAGSCTELNLMDRDVVNLPLVRQLNCPWLLVANIDPGGVFAQIVGTKACVTERDWELCAGIVVNKLRGETKYFEPGPAMIEEMVGKKVFVVPYKYDLNLPEEDGLGVERRLAKEHLLSSTSSTGSDDNAKKMKNKPTVVVLAYPHVAITSDLTPLESDPLLNVEWRRHVLPDAPYPHVEAIILPGSRLTRSDLDWLKTTPWFDFLKQHAAKGGAILGLCGGYQMLGMTVADPDGVEGAPGVSDGLGLLPVETTIATASCKIVTPRAGVLYHPCGTTTTPGGDSVDADGLVVEDLKALSVEGFELHCGRTAKITDNDTEQNNTTSTEQGGAADGPEPTASTLGSAQPLVIFTDDISKTMHDTNGGDASSEAATDEEGIRVGRVCGTYLHGILAKRKVRRALLLGEDVVHDTDKEDEQEEVDSLDLFANHLADCGLDFETVSNMIKW